MRIYIAGPYSADDEVGRVKNVNRAIDVGYEILQKGHYPFIPHLMHYFDVWCGYAKGARLPKEVYYEWDKEFLKLCDAFFFISSSPGADMELAEAKRLAMPIFYKLEDIPDESKPQRVYG